MSNYRYDLSGIVSGIAEHTNIIPKNIFEIGSRDGNDAHLLAETFKLDDNACYVFEAIREHAHNIKCRYPLMNVYSTVISDVTGNVDFNIEPYNGGSSSLCKRIIPTDGTKSSIINSIRMDDFINKENIKNIDVLKLDVEGATLRVLNSFGSHINILQSIQVECEHVDAWVGGDTFNEVFKWLEEHGFVMQLFVLLRLQQSDSFWVRKNRLLT